MCLKHTLVCDVSKVEGNFDFKVDANMNASLDEIDNKYLQKVWVTIVHGINNNYWGVCAKFHYKCISYEL